MKGFLIKKNQICNFLCQVSINIHADLVIYFYIFKFFFNLNKKRVLRKENAGFQHIKTKFKLFFKYDLFG